MSGVATKQERRRRLQPEERREEILDSATELISTVGFNSATVDDFARAAGISRPGLLHYFPSKEALLGAVLDRRDEQDVAIGEAHYPRVSGPAEARQALTDLVQQNAERPRIVQLYTMLSAEALDAEHPAHEYFATHLLQWHPVPDIAAVQLSAFLDGLQLRWLRDRTIDFVDVWERFADLFFASSTSHRSVDESVAVQR